VHDAQWRGTAVVGRRYGIGGARDVFVLPLPEWWMVEWFQRDRLTDDGVYLPRHSNSVIASNPDANKGLVYFQIFSSRLNSIK